MACSLQARSLFHFQRADDEDSGGERTRGESSRATVRSSGACVHCKSLKVRCEFMPGENACQRCQGANINCLARSRKKRKPAPTHEDLQEKAHSQDCRIQSLLLQLDQLKHENDIRKWRSRACSDSATTYEALQNLKSWELSSRSQWMNIKSSPEIAISTEFARGRSLPGLTPPEIVRHCALYPADISELFHIYFEKVNPFFSLLDQDLHTPENLIWTCPFLFTVICSTASRYCSSKPGLYSLAREFARDAAGKALVDGSKSIDVCQAYLILAVYPVPKKRWAEDRSWLLMGVAIRLALELELHRPSPSSDDREVLNRIRTWLNCYCVDGSHAIQFGKRPMLQLDDYMAVHSDSFYRSSAMNIAYDVHLCAYVQMIIIMAKWKTETREEDLPQKIREGFDVVAAAIETEECLSNELSQWVSRYNEEYTLNPMLVCAYRGNTTQMITAYLRLVVLAVGFQHAVKSGVVSRESDILKRSIEAARTVIQIMLERLYPTPFLRYAMEANFLYVSFSAAYLINLLRPTLLHLLDEDMQEDIVFTVNRLIEVLGSKEVALDGRHTPSLYSRFLSSLLAKYKVKSPRRSITPQDGVKFYPQYSDVRQVSPPGHSWPDIRQSADSIQSPDESQGSGRPYQQSNEVEMDFSFTHFVRTVSQNSTSFGYESESWSPLWPGRQTSPSMNGQWSSHSEWRQ